MGQKKIRLVTRILHLSEDDDNYARDILEEQYNNGCCGITKEVVDICLPVGLKNACKVYVSREEVREAMMYDHLCILKMEMEALKKLDRISKEDCRYMQDYMTQRSLEDARPPGVPLEDGYDQLLGLDAGDVRGLKAFPHCSKGRDAG